MAKQSAAGVDTSGDSRACWVPMIVIAMSQMLMSFNVAAIPVSMGVWSKFSTRRDHGG